MSTLLQLVNEVLRRTGQVEVSTLSGAQTPAEQTRDFLNEVYFEMLQRLRVNRLVKADSLSTVSGINAYNLANDADIDALLADSLFEPSSQSILHEVDTNYPQTHGSSVQGRPTRFYRSNGKIILYPTPNTVYIFQYRYLAKPANLSADTDTSLIPEDWEKVLVLGTQARLEKFLGEGGAETFALYRDGLAQLKSRSPLKPQFRMKGFYRGYS
jgi:hypothetical protein